MWFYEFFVDSPLTWTKTSDIVGSDSRTKEEVDSSMSGFERIELAQDKDGKGDDEGP